MCASCRNRCAAHLQGHDENVDDQKDGIQRRENVGDVPVVHFPIYHTAVLVSNHGSLLLLSEQMHYVTSYYQSSEHGRLQISTCSGYGLYDPG